MAAGFAGVLLMLEPHGGVRAVFGHGFSAGAVLALGGALCSAFVVVFIRQMSATEKSETIVFYFMLTGTAVGAATMLWDAVALTQMMTFWLVLCGLLGGIGQICMTYSYRYAEPSLLAPFDYAAMVWAVLLGLVLFAEVPETLVMAGAGVVTASGAVHRLARARAGARDRVDQRPFGVITATHANSIVMARKCGPPR